MDQALVPDDVMRPWTQDPLLDEKINRYVKQLDDTIVEMSPQAAVRGRSVLDNKPIELLELEKITNADPLGWIDAMLAGLTEEEYNALVSQVEADREGDPSREAYNNDGQEESETKVSSEKMAALSQQNKLLMRTIMQLNAALKKQGEKDKKEPKQLKQFFRLTGTKNMRKPTLSSIKYKPRPGPAVFNISTAEFKRFFERQGISIEMYQKVTRKAMPSAEELAQLKSLSEDKLLERWAASKLDLLAQDSAEAYDRAPEIDRSFFETGKGNPIDLLAPLGVTPTVPDRPLTAALQLSPLSPLPTQQQLQQQQQQQQQQAIANNSQVNLVPVSPIKRSAPVPTLPLESLNPEGPSQQVPTNNTAAALSREKPLTPRLSASRSVPELTPPPVYVLPPKSADRDTLGPLVSPKPALSPVKQLGGNMNKMSGGVPGGAPVTYRPSTAPVNGKKTSATPRPGSKSLDRFDAANSTKALNKIGISGTTGTVISSLFAKSRLQEIKSLRDQLMTTQGSFAMNVHPEANPDNVKDSRASVELTKKLAIQTVERNRLDQTWTLLSTPGYYEAVGPDKAFKSECHMFHTTNEAFEKAVREADTSLGIQKDPLRVWSESAVKQKIKLFTAGGAMKI